MILEIGLVTEETKGVQDIEIQDGPGKPATFVGGFDPL
jgi:hypothetical protein